MKNKLILPVLDADKVTRALNAEVRAGLAELHVAGEISSTSDYVLGRAADAQRGAIICVAESQTAGRGRNGRQWVSPRQANIYLSMGYYFPGRDVASLSCLSLAIGVEVCDWLSRKGLKVGIKWPNDVLVNGKKLLGMLIESRVTSGRVVAVIGVGLNVAMPPVEIDQPWTDITKELGVDGIEREKIAAELIDVLYRSCALFNGAGFEPFKVGWQRYDLLGGRKVSVVENEAEFVATVVGLDNDCALRLGTAGEHRSVYAADIKLKLEDDDSN